MSISPDLLAFMRHNLTSVWALELLLLMRAAPDRDWTAPVLVAELRASEPLVTGILEHLGRTGLVRANADGSVRYAPAGATIAALCDQLEAAYRQRPVAVIGAISAPADKLQALADAFRIRGD
jgi:hypothetical protein